MRQLAIAQMVMLTLGTAIELILTKTFTNIYNLILFLSMEHLSFTFHCVRITAVHPT